MTLKNGAASYFYNQKIQAMKKLVTMSKIDPNYNLILTEKELEVLPEELPKEEIKTFLTTFFTAYPSATETELLYYVEDANI